MENKEALLTTSEVETINSIIEVEAMNMANKMKDGETERLAINVVPEHDAKYNVNKDALALANEKLKNIGKVLPADMVQKGDIITKRRTKADYENIWRAFCEKEEKDFFKIIGYGKQKIKKIGIKKFIDFMDWRSEEDISKWRTDKLHAVVCVHCHREFAFFEYDNGLCSHCKPKYDLKRFNEAISASPSDIMEVVLLFMYNKDFRDKYLIKSLDQRIREANSESFEGMDSFYLLRDAVKDKNICREIREWYKKQKIKIPKKVDLRLIEVEESDNAESAMEVITNIYLKAED